MSVAEPAPFAALRAGFQRTDGIQSYIFFGPPPASDKAAAATALVSYAVFAAIIRALERRAGTGRDDPHDGLA